ncbi:MAG TPA: hypothetical protein DCR98_02640, partial [Cobetia sp.]|nr:hypothetical protein [Cobetia sp.]
MWWRSPMPSSSGSARTERCTACRVRSSFIICSGRHAMAKRKTIALALGSGGARGYAHIGVIEEVLARGYDIRAISGCSMGSL